MKIRKAIKLAEDGKKLRRPTWHKDAYVAAREGSVMDFYFKGCITNAKFTVNDLLADDWEVVE